MLSRFLLLLFFWPCLLCAQITDPFSDGNFTLNPTWTGTDSFFMVDSSGMLQSAGPDASSVLFLSTPFTSSTEMEWQFLLHLRFNPSSTNFCRVYLHADLNELPLSQQALYIQIGQSGAAPDSLKVYYTSGTQTTCLLTGNVGCCTQISNNRMRLRVKRTGNLWTMDADCNGGYAFATQGTFSLNLPPSTSRFGWVCDYNTPSRKDQYLLDEVYVGTPVADTLHPRIESTRWADSLRLTITFSESVELSDESITFLSAGPAASVETADQRTFLIQRPSPVFSGTYDSIGLKDIRDAAGLLLTDSLLVVPYYIPLPGDVVIHEILADPIPSYGLPQTEYVELLNRSAFPVSLTGWTFRDAGTHSILPDTLLPPGGMAVLTVPDSASAFLPARVIGLSPMPSLNNDGEYLELLNEKGQLIHSIQYALSWHTGQLAKDGGYALEMRDAAFYCGGEENWSSSISPTGGTPGSENSVKDIISDNKPPLLVQTLWIAPDRIRAEFDEDLFRHPGQSLIFVPGENCPAVSGFFFPDSLPKAVDVKLEQTANSTIIHTLHVQGIQDCKGYTQSQGYTLVFGNTKAPEPGELVINELLYNPTAETEDFIEVKNISAYIIDLGGCLILERDILPPHLILSYLILPDRPVLLLPGACMAFTSSKKTLCAAASCRDEAAILETPGLPNWPDDKGIVVWSNRQQQSIDSIAYSDDWHGPYLSDAEGYSLERISEENVWHSASAVCRFTPGKSNSQQQQERESDGALSVSNNLFSPDNDGYEDILVLDYNLPDPGLTVRLSIWNESGRRVIRLLNNEPGGTEGTCYWDGRTEDGQIAPLGLYLVILEWYDGSGRRGSQKKVVAIAGK